MDTNKIMTGKWLFAEDVAKFVSIRVHSWLTEAE